MTTTTSTTTTTTDGEILRSLEVTTDRLFYERGVAGVTMADIRDASGVSLRRIYGLCPSKADLVSLWLRRRHRSWNEMIGSRVDTALASGRTPVDAVFDAISGWMTATDFRGCGFINTFAETTGLTDEHTEIIRDHKRELTEWLDELVGNGPEVALLVDGAIVQAAMFSSGAPVESARAVAAGLVADR